MGTQGTTSSNPKTQERNQVNSSSNNNKVSTDIYQKGKVGIGYSSALGIDFNVNKTQKQLEVGGDFRTSHYDSEEGYYYGIETNSLALPSDYQAKGNVMFSAKSKDLQDHSYYDSKIYDGSMLLQSKDKIHFFSRNGVISIDSIAKSAEFKFQSDNIDVIVAQTALDDKNDILNYYKLNADYFLVGNNQNYKGKFGLDFKTHKFFIGNMNEGGYNFPNSKGLKGQFLTLKNDEGELEWSDIAIQPKSMAPKFFYMPSLLLPTDGIETEYVKYNESTKEYTVDLHKALQLQFNNPIKSSNAAIPTNINLEDKLLSVSSLSNLVLPRNEYEYHIIYADNNVFPHNKINFIEGQNSVGIFTYEVNEDAIIRNGSFMNVVIKVK